MKKLTIKNITYEECKKFTVKYYINYTLMNINGSTKKIYF